MKPHVRLIPVLLLNGQGLYKGICFKNHTYVGDPINTVKLFNEKDADEIFLLNVAATTSGSPTPIELIKRIAEECYMPFGVGGGIRTLEDMRTILQAGAEKVSINTAAIENPDLINEASRCFGSQSITVSIDVNKGRLGEYAVYTRAGTKKADRDPVQWATEAAERGAGEILLTSIDRDGKQCGYDLALIQNVCRAVNIPVIACGGAGSYQDLAQPITAGSAAAAAGTIFVFTGKHRAVLVQYPSPTEREKIFA